ncbi:MAG: DEAD/DEAH box helicase [Treponema sp.]|jgi:ATP-dependent Lhr-like helicase|nr:DEAD/DEAH box helicase [Treponema sp.]
MELPFHPVINAWFTETYGKPTAVQEQAWPLIVQGEHVLALAPTGSGKTLTGFLAAISRFADGSYPADRLSVLYVSPLKALNEDIRRNLESPLASLRERFEKAGVEFPPVRAETRSGDTTQAERRRFRMRPPSILALTPESLAILLVNQRGREILSDVRYLILDEIHTALGTKRGAFLSCQIDRLSLIAGEFQRVALSATVKPPEEAAAFAGGLKKTVDGSYRPRKLRIIAPETEKKINFGVEFPETPDAGSSRMQGGEEAELIKTHERYRVLSDYILERIRSNCAGGRKGTVLVFTDSRRRAERLAFILNETGLGNESYSGRTVAYTHHGSLSVEVRRAVEKALVSGEIPCVVATSSLELGIDIGTVDEVILAGTPFSTASVMQRVGRSGHGVGMESRGRLFPFHGMDLLQAAAAAGALSVRELEETRALENPLDLLAQIILSLCAEQDCHEDELYEMLRGFYVYRNLSRASFDGIAAMLTGEYEGQRLRELKKRLYRDEKNKILSAAPGAAPLLYSSGGVIASRGCYTMRLGPTGNEKTGTRIGELDEEFVWERRVGDSFDFGGRSWRISAITHEAVEVVPLKQLAGYAPFWKGDSAFRSPVLSRRMREILEERNNSKLNELSGFNDEATDALNNFLGAQKSLQGKVPLSGHNFIAVEVVDDPSGRADARSLVYHTFRGGSINYPLSLALAAEFEDALQMRIESVSDDNSILIRLPRLVQDDPAVLAETFLLKLAGSDLGIKRFRERFESSGVFGAAFREAAERSLVLPRSPFGKRVPLWVIRQKSKWLFDAVSSHRDFPITAEAWRTSLSDSFDMKGFSSFLEDLLSGAIKLGIFFSTHPSPFSQGLAWAETNALMYEYDERPDLRNRSGQGGDASTGRRGQGGKQSLLDELIEEALGRGASRPVLPENLILSFTSRLMRELPGWAPEDETGLCEWVKERIAIPCAFENNGEDEWERLLRFVPEELKEAWEKDHSLGGRLAVIKREAAAASAIVHHDRAKLWEKGKPSDLAKKYLSQWLRFEGPVPPLRIGEVFGFDANETEETINALEEAGELVRDVEVEGSSRPPHFYAGRNLAVDRENLELLLRLFRRKRREGIRERPASVLVPFLAKQQGLCGSANEKLLSNLEGIPIPAKLWETEIFPARNPAYRGDDLDREIREGRLIWYGTGKEKCCFSSIEELDLTLPSSSEPDFNLPAGFFHNPKNFWEIRDALGLDNASCTAALWKEAWKGSISSDSWEALRRALETGFTLAGSEEEPARAREGSISKRRIPRALKERWRSGPPVRGNWFSLALEKPAREEGQDSSEPVMLLEEESLKRERVRLLLRRWGVLCRPLLERETPLFSWQALLPSMRRMELAGELIEGRFFSGINSLQFASPSIDRELKEAETEESIYWMNAADPASPLGLSELTGHILEQAGPSSLPSRLPSTRLYFRGQTLAALSLRNGKEINFYIPHDDACLSKIVELIKLPRKRAVMSESKITIEKINAKNAARSEYAAAFKEADFMSDRGKLVLW